MDGFLEIRHIQNKKIPGTTKKIVTAESNFITSPEVRTKGSEVELRLDNISFNPTIYRLAALRCDAKRNVQ